MNSTVSPSSPTSPDSPLIYEKDDEKCRYHRDDDDKKEKTPTGNFVSDDDDSINSLGNSESEETNYDCSTTDDDDDEEENTVDMTNEEGDSNNEKPVEEMTTTDRYFRDLEKTKKKLLKQNDFLYKTVKAAMRGKHGTKKKDLYPILDKYKLPYPKKYSYATCHHQLTCRWITAHPGKIPKMRY